MSETKVFLLPDLGEGLTEAELVNWLVAVGDEIHVDRPDNDDPGTHGAQLSARGCRFSR
jgi:hypothetical protein